MNEIPRSHATTIVAILAIMTLDAIALTHGINGVLFMTALAAICGIAGYKLGKPKPPDG